MLCAGVPVSSRQAMVRETVRTYSSRLPAPSIYNGTGQSPSYKGNKQARPPRDDGEPRLQREEQVQEILELKKALAKTRQDLQKTRSRRQDRDNRSSSDEVSIDCSANCTWTILAFLQLSFILDVVTSFKGWW